jgi:hypothetical protein
MGYSLVDPAIMPPIPVPDEFSLRDTVGFAACFVGGRLVTDRQTVVMELFHNLHPLPNDVPARIILATTSKRPGFVLKRFLPRNWTGSIGRWGFVPVGALTQNAEHVFDAMEVGGIRIQHLPFPCDGVSAVLISAHRSDPVLQPFLEFNRRSPKPMVKAVTLVHFGDSTAEPDLPAH